MTTDVTNVQNAYQMIIRIAVRAPLMLICSMAMCFAVSGSMSTIFLAAIVLLCAKPAYEHYAGVDNEHHNRAVQCDKALSLYEHLIEVA